MEVCTCALRRVNKSWDIVDAKHDSSSRVVENDVKRSIGVMKTPLFKSALLYLFGVNNSTDKFGKDAVGTSGVNYITVDKNPTTQTKNQNTIKTFIRKTGNLTVNGIWDMLDPVDFNLNQKFTFSQYFDSASRTYTDAYFNALPNSYTTPLYNCGVGVENEWYFSIHKNNNQGMLEFNLYKNPGMRGGTIPIGYQVFVDKSGLVTEYNVEYNGQTHPCDYWVTNFSPVNPPNCISGLV